MNWSGQVFRLALGAMIAIVILGIFGLVVLGTGLSLLLRKPVGSTLPPRGPAMGVLALGVALVAVALWGGKNPRQLTRFIKPEAVACPKILGPDDLYELTQDRATQFSGRKVEGGWCQYDFEFRSGKKLKGKVEVDLSLRQDEWMKTCGNHPLSQGAAEVWMKKLDNDEQLLCFLTASFEGAIWLDKEADGLKWVRVLQGRLPLIAAD